ncbi:MAG: DUF4838 domain-containing protein [Ruminococcaceae bacterium]|nr:DUF4838 domain-containing protein [Oscillospiraceae bacterium]
MRIIFLQRNETVEYAAAELKKYLLRMSRGKINAEIFCEDISGEGIPEETIVLATLPELSLDTSDLFDAFVEDIIDIDVKNLSGYIAGSNPRSILMGVYKYCTSAGCRFFRPGEDGEYIPEADLRNHSYKYRKKADHPFRGECTEGAASYEHYRDAIYFLPKIGMNMFMIEGVVPYTYMHKWYGHVGNDKLRPKGQVTDYDMLESYTNLLEADIRKTGLQFHSLGHAWMFNKLGIRHASPMEEQAGIEALTAAQKKNIALVGGKRELIEESTFYTHFCYSNPEARKLLVDTLVEHLRAKPHIDFLHVWLADYMNNNCECENCITMQPSDWYVLLLNEIDEALTAMGFETRIVLIMYVDTVRPPVKLRLNNPKRFTLLAAIGLHYDKGYINEEYTGEIPEFVRNDFHPEPNALRLKWHREWKELCGNIPSMIFEYRFYTDMYCDIAQMQISRETYRDMRALESVSFQGCMTDRTPRMYLPTSLPFIMMGETLFDKSVDYDAVADTYFEGAFGQDGAKVRTYLEEMSRLLSPSSYRIGGGNGVEEGGLGDIEADNKAWINNPDVAKKASEIPMLTDSFVKTIERNIGTETDASRRLSWVYLRHHAEIVRSFAKMLLAGAENRLHDARLYEAELEEYITEHELELHNVLDVFLFQRNLRLKLDLPRAPYFN